MPRKPWLALLLCLSLAVGAAPMQAGAAALDHHRTHQGGSVSDKSLKFNQEMRQLWTDHALWTKLFMVSFFNNLPDKDIVLNRLLRNQKDIGNAFKPYYGEEAGNKIGQLLTQHILTAAPVLEAIKEKNQSKLEAANKAWFQNADDIAKALSGLNPNWSYEELKNALYEHLKLLLADAMAIANSNWSVDVEATDKGLAHLMEIADILWAGVVKQFPKKF